MNEVIKSSTKLPETFKEFYKSYKYIFDKYMLSYGFNFFEKKLNLDNPEDHEKLRVLIYKKNTPIYQAFCIYDIKNNGCIYEINISLSFELEQVKKHLEECGLSTTFAVRNYGFEYDSSHLKFNENNKIDSVEDLDNFFSSFEFILSEINDSSSMKDIEKLYLQYQWFGILNEHNYTGGSNLELLYKSLIISKLSENLYYEKFKSSFFNLGVHFEHLTFPELLKYYQSWHKLSWNLDLKKNNPNQIQNRDLYDCMMKVEKLLYPIMYEWGFDPVPPDELDLDYSFYFTKPTDYGNIHLIFFLNGNNEVFTVSWLACFYISDVENLFKKCTNYEHTYYGHRPVFYISQYPSERDAIRTDEDLGRWQIEIFKFIEFISNAKSFEDLESLYLTSLKNEKYFTEAHNYLPKPVQEIQAYKLLSLSRLANNKNYKTFKDRFYKAIFADKYFLDDDKERISRNWTKLVDLLSNI